LPPRFFSQHSDNIVGHSDGGEVALLLAALHKDVARSVVVWGAAGVANETHRNAVSFFRDVVDDMSEDSAEYRDYLIKAYGEQNARSMTQSFARAMTAIIEDNGDISRSRADGSYALFYSLPASTTSLRPKP
jgi:valacyclovir hydrolase